MSASLCSVVALFFTLFNVYHTLSVSEYINIYKINTFLRHTDTLDLFILSAVGMMGIKLELTFSPPRSHFAHA